MITLHNITPTDGATRHKAAALQALLLTIVAAIAITACGGSSDDDNDPTPQPTPTPTPVIEERPTTWVAPTSDVYLPSSMTMTIQPADSFKVSSQDLIAAFINGTCRAVASPQKSNLFYLTIRLLNSDDQTTTLPVSLRYYSASRQRIYYSADAINFVGDADYGSPTQPYIPLFYLNN